jgi:hypothetical protein
MATRTIEIDESDLDLILDAIRTKSHHHKSNYNRIKNSGYGSAATQDKAKKHKDLADDLDRIETTIAYSFI